MQNQGRHPNPIMKKNTTSSEKPVANDKAKKSTATKAIKETTEKPVTTEVTKTATEASLTIEATKTKAPITVEITKGCRRHKNPGIMVV